MAVAYQSQQTATHNTAGTPLVITKPTSLAAGDLMIAFLYGGRNINDWATLSGWTRLGAGTTTAGTDANMTVLAKVADAGDAAATDFTFTPNGAHEEKYGILVRITGNFGAGIGALVVSDFDNDVINTATGGVTPIAANSLLLMGIITHDSNSGSTFAVTNNNPSWTSRNSGFVDTAVDMSYALGTATYSVATGTGTYTWASGSLAGACLISVSEGVDATTPGGTGVLTATGNGGTPAGAATATGGTGVLTLTGNGATPTTPAARFLNEDKPSVTAFQNEDKPT